MAIAFVVLFGGIGFLAGLLVGRAWVTLVVFAVVAIGFRYAVHSILEPDVRWFLSLLGGAVAAVAALGGVGARRRFAKPS